MDVFNASSYNKGFPTISTTPHKKFLLLGAFPKFRKATISFVMPSSPSVGMGKLGSHWADFH
jgi:hypothetical protein